MSKESAAAGIREKQKQKILAEATTAGLTLVAASEEKIGEAPGGVGLAFFGGTAKPDHMQRFVFNGPAGRVTFFQPFHGFLPMPGEYHATIPGALDDAVTLRAPRVQRLKLRIYLGIVSLLCLPLHFLVRIYLLNPKWIDENKSGAAKQLNKVRAVRKASRQLKYYKRAGGSVFYPKWGAQLTPSGDGKSQLVMKSGGYGGYGTHKIGVDAFLKLQSALIAALASAASSPEAIAMPKNAASAPALRPA